METYFTSDTHLGHANIIRHCDRPFTSVQEMDATIIENWNQIIRPSDQVFHLGDFSFRNTRQDYFRALNGQKFLLKGNHDDQDTFRLGWGWVKDVYYLRLGGERIWLSHYAHRTWKNSAHGSWHLYGHSHGKFPSWGKSFDVGVDVWDFTPLHFEQVRDMMQYLQQVELKGHDLIGR